MNHPYLSCIYYFVFRFLAFLMLRCMCKKYRASFRLCLFCYCFCRKRSIAPLLFCAFLPESPIALHGSIVPISFLHIACIEPAALPPYITHLHQYFTICFHTMKYYILQNVKILKASFVPSTTHYYFLYKSYITPH